MSKFETVIKQHLDARAAQDPQFAEKYANPAKNVKACCAYILSEARRRAKGSDTFILPDEEVFGMAIHYFDEDSIVVKENDLEAAKESNVIALTEEEKAAAKAEAISKYKAQIRATEAAKAKAKKEAAKAKEKAAKEAKIEAYKKQREEEGELNLFNLMGI
ncbi:MAG: PcfK-like family protein [Bacteroidales bacterium]|nr:PcfK-like family protein [Bacteroidales bacterium]